MNPPASLGEVLLLGFLLLRFRLGVRFLFGLLVAFLCFGSFLRRIARLLDDFAHDLLERQRGVSPLEDDRGNGVLGIPLPGVGRDVRDGDRGVEQVVEKKRDMGCGSEGEGAGCRRASERQSISANLGFAPPHEIPQHSLSFMPTRGRQPTPSHSTCASVNPLPSTIGSVFNRTPRCCACSCSSAASSSDSFSDSYSESNGTRDDLNRWAGWRNRGVGENERRTARSGGK